MRRNHDAKYPQSMELFKFTQKVISHQKGERANNQDIGSILGFNPPDCSHWKRGTKNVRSVFDLQKIADALGIDRTLLFDIASGLTGVDEAYFEYLESQNIRSLHNYLSQLPPSELAAVRQNIFQLIAQWHERIKFQAPPLYLPELIRCFTFVTIQPADVIDKLSRVLRVRSSSYLIHYRQGELKPQTRLSMTKNLAQILLEAERHRFPKLGKVSKDTIEYEKLLFISELLCPRDMLQKEMRQVDPKTNLTAELSAIFWVPKTLINYQLKSLLTDRHLTGAAAKKAPRRRPRSSRSTAKSLT